MSKRESKFLRKQKFALGVIGTLVIAVTVYLFTVVISDKVEGEYIEGEHYFAIEKPRRIRGDKVEVMEFFSYGCVHCYNFDPILADWVEENNQQVKFTRMPAVANEYWRVLGQTYFTMEKLGLLDEYHFKMFREVHDVKRSFATVNLLANYFDGNGTTAAEFETAFSSPEVLQKVSLADKMSRRMKVASVPTIVVAGKYQVNVTRSVGTARMLDVMDFLVEKELSERQSKN